MQVSFLLNLEGGVTKSAPHLALKVIAWDKLTFDERVVFTRMAVRYRERPNSSKYAPTSPLYAPRPARLSPPQRLEGTAGVPRSGLFLMSEVPLQRGHDPWDVPVNFGGRPPTLGPSSSSSLLLST